MSSLRANGTIVQLCGTEISNFFSANQLQAYLLAVLRRDIDLCVLLYALAVLCRSLQVVQANDLTERSTQVSARLEQQR